MAIYLSRSNQANIKKANEALSKGEYTSYLHSIRLNKIRGFVNQLVEFPFPVMAIIAPNGGGKTTILGAACLPYMDIKPSVFIQHSRSVDDNMNGWNVECDITVPGMVPKHAKPKPETTRFTANVTFKIGGKGKRGWNRRDENLPQRLPTSQDTRSSIVVLGIGRTIPAVEKSEFVKFANTDFTGLKTEDIGGSKGENTQKYIAAILGKSVAGYQSRAIERAKSSKLTGDSDLFFTGVTSDGNQFSEFHFGAGESSVIRMVTAIENARNGALVLIEELENGLHPLASKRMVEYLIEASERKKLQILFTTHSNDALEPLPSNAVCAIVNWRVYQNGKLTVELLREMRGETDKQLFIYVEDKFAERWMRAIMQRHQGVNADTVQVYAISSDFTGPGGGAGDIPKMVDFHRRIPSTIKTIPAIGYIDGKSPGVTPDAGRHVYQLPGGDQLDPEAYILQAVLEKTGELESILDCQPSQKADFISTINRIITETKDAHNLFVNIGERFERSPEETANYFIRTWMQLYPELVEEITKVIQSYIPSAEPAEV
jgi:hypothetical protein